MSEREKAALRHKVLTLPITHEYPFDPEAKLLRCVGIKPSMLDIGANTGIYSAILEDLVGSENLYLFEPIPYLHQYLKRRFKKAHIFDCALSDSEGKKVIQVPYIDGKRYDTRSTFNIHIEPNQTGFDEIEVQLMPLDRIAEKIPFDSIGFIKIDVEGHELQVLNGAIETVTRFKPLMLVEIESRHHQFPITRIFSWFEEIGYKGYYLKPETFELLETVQFDADRDQNLEYLKLGNIIHYLNNFFFIHEASEKDFVVQVVAFLESEKRFVEPAAATNG